MKLPGKEARLPGEVKAVPRVDMTGDRNQGQIGEGERHCFSVIRKI
jgi:hypothetical protein